MLRQIRAASPLPGPASLSLICLLLISGLSAMRAADAPADSLRCRLAVSETLIGTDVNQKDANLAMRAWRDAVFKQSGLLIDFNVAPFPQLVREVREQRVDGFTVTTLEFLELEKYAGSTLMVDEQDAKGGEEYLLLVHEDSGIRAINDLRGKSVNICDDRKMCLAGMWLETVISSANLGAPQAFLGRMVPFTKLSRAVLPVYFRQADACLVTRRGFSTMCELNPQLGNKLRIVASSPKLIPSLMAFQKGFVPEQRQKLIAALSELNRTVSGQQALTLFESSQLVAADSSLLRSTLDLVKTHERAGLKAGAVRK